MRRAGLAIIFAATVTACAPLEGESTGGATVAGPALQASLRAEPGELKLSQHRVVRVVFSLVNTSRRQLRLDFPTGQHLEVALRSPGGRRIFLWSEDRNFAPEASSVVVNPGERLEYEAEVPTREMVAGGIYAVEASLPGYPATVSTVCLAPD